MSLLLDALKKSGESEQKTTGLADIQLEESHVSPTRQQTDFAPNTSSRTQPAPPSSGNTSTRAAGENLFAAKKAPAKKRQRLGIVPIALIAGGLFATIGGIYVYWEITPPNQRPFYHPPAPPAPPAATAAATPITTPQPAVVQTAPAPLPLTPAPEAMPPAAVEEKPHSLAPQAGKPAVEKKMAARSAKPARAKNKQLGIEHKPQPDSIDPVLASAYQAYQSGDNAAAWQRYREALAKEPRNRDALLGLAAIAQQQGQDEAALHYYRQVLALDPRDPVANAGLSMFGGGDPASKESHLKQLIAQQPDSAALHFALGNQYAEQSRWSDAQQSYFDALAMEPANALFAFNLATSLDHLGQRKTAAMYYQQALRFDTTGHSGFNRAQAQQRLDELTAAGH